MGITAAPEPIITAAPNKALRMALNITLSVLEAYMAQHNGGRSKQAQIILQCRQFRQ